MGTLPNRRPCITQTLDFMGKRHHVTIGFNPETHEALEVWCYGPKVGSGQHNLLQDVCHDVSIQLQDGRPIEDMAAKAQRDANGEPLSIYRVLADELMMVR